MKHPPQPLASLERRYCNILNIKKTVLYVIYRGKPGMGLEGSQATTRFHIPRVKIYTFNMILSTIKTSI